MIPLNVNTALHTNDHKDHTAMIIRPTANSVCVCVCVCVCVRAGVVVSVCTCVDGRVAVGGLCPHSPVFPTFLCLVFLPCVTAHN